MRTQKDLTMRRQKDKRRIWKSSHLGGDGNGDGFKVRSLAAWYLFLQMNLQPFRYSAGSRQWWGVFCKRWAGSCSLNNSARITRQHRVIKEEAWGLGQKGVCVFRNILSSPDLISEGWGKFDTSAYTIGGKKVGWYVRGGRHKRRKLFYTGRGQELFAPRKNCGRPAPVIVKRGKKGLKT